MRLVFVSSAVLFVVKTTILLTVLGLHLIHP
jgi:hypothetical protein